MDWGQIGTGLAQVLGLGGVGAVILKLAQVWLLHSRAVTGDFTSRSTTDTHNFEVVVGNLQSQIEQLLTRQREADAANVLLRDENWRNRVEYEKRLAAMQDEINDLRRESREITRHLHDREIILLIEDREFDMLMIKGVLGHLLAETGLELTWVQTMAKARRYERSARVIIADVMLPDTMDDKHHEQLLSLIHRAGCPVIVNSGTEYAEGSFPGAFGVLVKTDTVDRFVQMVTVALSRQPQEGES